MSTTLLCKPTEAGPERDYSRLCVVGRALRVRMARPSAPRSIAIVGESICPWVAPAHTDDGWLGRRICRGKDTSGRCLWSYLSRVERNSARGA